jgi:hypothetical protein
MVRYTILLAVVCLVLASCESSSTKIHFKLYGQGASFSGEYTVDDGDESSDFTAEESTTDVFVYRSDTVEVSSSVAIDVFPEATADTDDDDDETDMTSLTCKVFDSNGTLLYEDTYSITSTHMKTFTFNLDSATDSTSTDDTD